MNKEQVLSALDEIAETHFITLLRAAIVVLYEENESLNNQLIELQEMQE